MRWVCASGCSVGECRQCCDDDAFHNVIKEGVRLGDTCQFCHAIHCKSISGTTYCPSLYVSSERLHPAVRKCRTAGCGKYFCNSCDLAEIAYPTVSFCGTSRSIADVPIVIFRKYEEPIVSAPNPDLLEMFPPLDELKRAQEKEIRSLRQAFTTVSSLGLVDEQDGTYCPSTEEDEDESFSEGEEESGEIISDASELCPDCQALHLRTNTK